MCSGLNRLFGRGCMVTATVLAVYCIAAGANGQSDKTPATKPAAPAATGAKSEAPDGKVCEHRASVLSGEATADSATLKDPELKALAGKYPDLVGCGAVRQDSDALCDLLSNEQAIRTCRENRSMFHELRAYPKGRGFMFNDVQAEECKKMDEIAKYCDPFRDAARAGDASKCSALGELGSVCRALIRLDPSLCKAPKGEFFERRRKESGDSNIDDTYGDDIAKNCVKQIEQKKVFARGLKAMSESGPGMNRELAKATLGASDSCAALLKPAVDNCKTPQQMPAPGTGNGPKAPPAPTTPTPEGTPAPSPPAPSAPALPGKG